MKPKEEKIVDSTYQGSRSMDFTTFFWPCFNGKSRSYKFSKKFHQLSCGENPIGENLFGRTRQGRWGAHVGQESAFLNTRTVPCITDIFILSYVVVPFRFGVEDKNGILKIVFSNYSLYIHRSEDSVFLYFFLH